MSKKLKINSLVTPIEDLHHNNLIFKPGALGKICAIVINPNIITIEFNIGHGIACLYNCLESNFKKLFQIL